MTNEPILPAVAPQSADSEFTKLLAKIVGKDRTIEQATRSEKRAASLGLHSLHHTNATAMDSLSIPQQIRKQRLGLRLMREK
jgi:hypothetical protein